MRFLSLVPHWGKRVALLASIVAAGTMLQAQSTGSLEGTVRLEANGDPLHNATVMIVELGRVAETDSDGRYFFEGVPAGAYSIISYTAALTSDTRLVEIAAGQSRSVDFSLRLSPLQHEITVTAKGRQETAFEAVQSVISVNPYQIAQRQATSIGEVLEGEIGVAKRSFGPGSTRPIIRGFDGDRVLVMQDGIRTGSLASQSGDHGEPIDPSNQERLEVLKGPATLLYGSNAVGGVVNAITGHHEIHAQPHQGTRGRISSVAGSANEHFGGSFNVEHGIENWLFWIGGGGQRTDDYSTPEGDVENSASRISNANGGFGWFGEKGFASIDYRFNDGRYGIPFAEEFHGHEEGEEEEGEEEEEEELENVDIAFRRHNVRFSSGIRNLGTAIDSFNFTLNYSDWNHDELELLEGGEQEVGTTFDNQQFIYRGVFEQSQRGMLSGSFGFWGLHRDYDVAGEEALSPPVDQNSFALFALQELSFEGVKLQFGGRLEHTDFEPQAPVLRGHDHGEGEEEGEEEEEGELVTLPDRDFTGVSGGIGVRVDTWDGGAFVANFTSSYRAPALEELYNFGPHVGNLAFEVGDPDLERERSNGFDLSLRHLDERVRAELNFFYYDIQDFVFLAPTGEVEDGLIEAEFLQGDSRFVGVEAEIDVGVHEYVWFNFGFDAVDAELTDSDEPLPRIPPFRARVGLDLRYQGLSVRPEIVTASERDVDDIFSTETRTGGYTVFNIGASYTLPGRHLTHHFAFDVFNLGDKLYRNHVSFIKDLAPEIGRGVRFAYVLDFY